MTQRTLPRSGAFNATSLETWLVAAPVALLAGLALADRLVAWMIGEFPTSATLWQIRFEYLRPIGVFHDIAVLNLGQVSSIGFNVAVGFAALAIGGAAISKVRIARALASHVLFGAAIVVTVYSTDPGEGIYAKVGVPSDLYALFGALLTIAAATACLRIHAEYVGWNPVSSRLGRKVNIGLRLALSRIGGAAVELLDLAIPAGHKGQAAFAHARHREPSARRVESTFSTSKS